MKLSLENILRITLDHVEESIESTEDAAALSELRRQLAISIAELEYLKSLRKERGVASPYLNEDVAA